MIVMKAKFIFLFTSLIVFTNSLAQDSKKIETIATINIINEKNFVIGSDTLDLNTVSDKINSLLDNFNDTDSLITSITLDANPSITENIIENLKSKIRSTPIQLINLQRKTINSYNGIVVNQDVLDQYNSLIRYWNSQAEEERFYRENELKFIESVVKNMTLDQRIRNEKLPGYLPFVKKEAKNPQLSKLAVELDKSYIYVYNNDTLNKETAFKTYKDNCYYIKRRIINEEKVHLVEIANR